MNHNGLAVNTSDFPFNDPSSIPTRGEYDLLFNVDIVNLLFKNNGWERQKASICYFVGGWVVMARCRKSYLGPAEISSFVSLVQFKDGGCRVRLSLHIFISDVDSGNKYLCGREWVQRFSCTASGMERFSLDLLRAVKIGCTLEEDVEVCGICGWRRNFFWLCNLKLGKAIKNLTCSDQ